MLSSSVRIAALAFLFVACTRTGGSKAPSSSDPESAVLAVFEAGKTGRCDDVLALLTTSQRDRLRTDKEGCPTLVKYLQTHPVERVHGVVQDGRHADWKIVRVALRNAELPRSFTVEMQEGRWKLASL